MRSRSLVSIALALGALTLGLALMTACRPDPVVGRLGTPAKAIRLGYPEAVPIRFDWTPLAPLVDPGGPPTVFVHLLDEHGVVRRTFDHPFPEDWALSRPEPVADEFDLYQSALAPPLPRGRYVLTGGLYDPGRQTRWRLDAGAPEAGKREYRIADVEVNEPTDPALLFELTGRWGPSEPDSSLQVLARRRLRGPATLRFTGAGGAGAIRLALTVKAAPLSLETDCAASRPDPLAPGYRWLSFDVAPGRPCTVRFDAPETAEGESGSTLDIAAFRPAPERIPAPSR